MGLARRQLLVLALCGTASLSVGCTLTPRSIGPAPGAAAPAFALPSHHGTTVLLAQLIEHRPAVVVFYRGYW